MEASCIEVGEQGNSPNPALYFGPMRARAAQIGATFILLIGFVGMLSEMFDTWDDTIQQVAIRSTL